MTNVCLFVCFYAKCSQEMAMKVGERKRVRGTEWLESVKSFCALAPAAERSLIEILHIKSPVDRCAAAAGCSAQPATTSRVNEEKKKKKRINHAPCNAQINQIRPQNFYISPKLIALIGSPCQMSPEALIGGRKQEAHAAITAPPGGKNKIK